MGESIACRFLVNKGFFIVDRNFQRPYGELDIVCKKDNTIHFFEVKSVTTQTPLRFFDAHAPEENVDRWKVQHIRRMIEVYMAYTNRGVDVQFQFHIMCVYMNMENRKARVKWLKNVIL